jgi:hypothetical protein
MARTKKMSSVLESAQTRLAALSSIDPKLSLGAGLGISDYNAQIACTRQALDTYNTLLSQVDEAYNSFLADEASLRDLNERMLAGVGAIYGKDSSQYEMAGGARKSEIKRAPRKKAAA